MLMTGRMLTLHIETIRNRNAFLMLYSLCDRNHLKGHHVIILDISLEATHKMKFSHNRTVISPNDCTLTLTHGNMGPFLPNC